MSQEKVEVVRRALEAFNRGDLDGAQYHPEEFIDAGETVVGVVRVINARGRLSGIGEQDFAAAPQLAVSWTFRNGLVVGQEMFRSRSEALEAVGLRE